MSDYNYDQVRGSRLCRRLQSFMLPPRQYFGSSRLYTRWHRPKKLPDHAPWLPGRAWGWLRLKVNARIRVCPPLVFGMKEALIPLL